MKYIYESLGDAPKASLLKHLRKRVPRFIGYGVLPHLVPAGTSGLMVGLGVARTKKQIDRNRARGLPPMHKVMLDKNFSLTPKDIKYATNRVVDNYQKYKSKFKSFLKKSDKPNDSVNKD